MGSEPVRETTLRRFTDAFGRCGFRPEAFYPCYGLAEATRMVDPSTGMACASEQVGEVWVTGPSVAAGYWNQPALTEENFGAASPSMSSATTWY
jgi:acyl-CoA synthetase (AMP-forming)/AMP-acid ligase II